MQKQQALQYKAEIAGTKMICRSSRRYTVIQKQQALNSNEKAAGATL
jgi:hypothetical protein